MDNTLASSMSAASLRRGPIIRTGVATQVQGLGPLDLVGGALNHVCGVGLSRWRSCQAGSIGRTSGGKADRDGQTGEERTDTAFETWSGRL